MHLKVCVVTHAIPITPGITVLAVVVLTVQKPVFVVNRFIQTYPGSTVSAVNMFYLLLFHYAVSIRFRSFFTFFTFFRLVHGQPVDGIDVIFKILRT